MELSNLISRGNFPVPQEWQGIFSGLIVAINDEDGYGIEFSNDVFGMQPYYWGDCECGYEKKVYEWECNNKHHITCYQTLLRSEKEKSNNYKEIYLKLIKQFNLPLEGCAVHCNCDYIKSWAKFSENHTHAPTCRIITPNFIYKPTNYQLRWYKYPLRNAHQSEKITKKDFLIVIHKCIDSVL